MPKLTERSVPRYQPTPRYEPKLAEKPAPPAEDTEDTSPATAPDAAPAEELAETVPPAETAGPACPHCGAPLIEHDAEEGPKVGAWHCDACGGCFVRDGRVWRMRPGHTGPGDWVDPP